jgi:hypothetical protein
VRGRRPHAEGPYVADAMIDADNQLALAHDRCPSYTRAALPLSLWGGTAACVWGYLSHLTASGFNVSKSLWLTPSFNDSVVFWRSGTRS